MKRQSQAERMIVELKARQRQYDMIYRTKQFFERESNPLFLKNRKNSNIDGANKQQLKSQLIKCEDQKRDCHDLTLQSLRCKSQIRKEKQQTLILDYGLLSAIIIPFLFLFGLMIWFKPT